MGKRWTFARYSIVVSTGPRRQPNVSRAQKPFFDSARGSKEVDSKSEKWAGGYSYTLKMSVRARGGNGLDVDHVEEADNKGKTLSDVP